jgi:hypothetical protein
MPPGRAATAVRGIRKYVMAAIPILHESDYLPLPSLVNMFARVGVACRELAAAWER